MFVLQEKVQELTSKMNLADDTIEKLRHEKLFPAQEKSEFVGQVKQLEKMLSNNNE